MGISNLVIASTAEAEYPNLRPTPEPSPAKRVGPGSEEIPTLAQFPPQGGNERPRELLTCPSPKRQRQDVSNSHPTPGPSPAERVGPGSEEIPMIAQFSPQGGNGAVMGISELAPPARLELTTFRLGGGPSILVRYGGLGKACRALPDQNIVTDGDCPVKLPAKKQGGIRYDRVAS